MSYRQCSFCFVKKRHNATIKEGQKYICRNCRNLRKPPPDKKVCTKCSLEKPFNAFGFRQGRVIGYSACMECVNTAAKNRTIKNGGYTSRDWHLKRRYNLTPEMYSELLQKQNGGCGGCGGPPTMSGGPHFHVDHNHKTGIVRGLLCGHCNHVLGLVHDNPEKLKKLIKYLHNDLSG